MSSGLSTSPICSRDVSIAWRTTGSVLWPCSSVSTNPGPHRHAHARVERLLAKGLGEGVHTELGHVVDGRAGVGATPGHGGDVDDVASPARRDQRQRGVRADEQPPQVDVEHPPPVGGSALITGPSNIRPALLTSTCRAPCSACACSMNERACCSSLTSTSWIDASPSSCSASASSRSRRRAASATVAPARERAVAVAAPMPDEAPVTAATRPARGWSAMGERWYNSPGDRDPFAPHREHRCRGASVRRRARSDPDVVEQADRLERPAAVRRMYFVSTMGITVGYHRLLTHRAFQTYKPVEYARRARLDGRRGAGDRLGRRPPQAPRPPDRRATRTARTSATAGFRGAARASGTRTSAGCSTRHGQATGERYAPDLVEDRGMRVIAPAVPAWVDRSAWRSRSLLGWGIHGNARRRLSRRSSGAASCGSSSCTT